MYSQPARYAAPTLGPQVCKRWASTKSTPRKGRKGYLYGATPQHPPPSPEEELRITRRRILKAERDERIDITIALTPVKTYMGGFTRPRDLRSSNWFPGGRYATIGKVYESPPAFAYEPHTVFLLQSRYPVKHGLGRVDCYDHVVGVCREGDFEAVLKRYNSLRVPRTELDAMDNARWPWGPQFALKRTKWWGPDENPQDILKEIFGEEGLSDSAYLDDPGRFEELGEEVEGEEVEVDTDGPRKMRANLEDEKSNPQSVESSTLVASVASAPSSFDTTAPSNPPTGEAADAHQGPAIGKSLMEHLSKSIMSDKVTATTTRRPEGKVPYEHSDEEGVLSHPSGYVIPIPGEAPNLMGERRSRHHDKQTAAVAERVQQAGDYTDIDAHTRLHANKIPYEAVEHDGSVSHLSGFVPPTPEHHSDSFSVDNHVQDAVQRQKRRTTAEKSSEEMSERQRNSDTIIERDEGDAELIVELNVGLDKAASKFIDNQKRGIHTSAVVSASEVTHPPTAVEEDDMDDMDDMDDIDDYEVPRRPVPPHLSLSPTKKKLIKFPKHGKAPKSRQTSLVPNPPPPIPSETQAIRNKYLPTLAETPFWLPLLSLTLSTRPLALTLARLSRARPRGLPFFATICNDDRKTHASYSARLQCMRIDRMEELTVQIAELLAGARGGFVGIRFGVQEKGRGIGGEGLEAPLSKDKRTIKVGVGNWYRRAEEVKEAFREDAITRVGEVGVGLKDIGETFEIFGLDDYGKRIDDKTGEVIPWPKSKSLKTSEFTKEYQDHTNQLDSDTSPSVDDDSDVDIVQVWRNEAEIRRTRKLKRQELARSYKDEIASELAQRHRAVMTP